MIWWASPRLEPPYTAVAPAFMGWGDHSQGHGPFVLAEASTRSLGSSFLEAFESVGFV